MFVFVYSKPPKDKWKVGKGSAMKALKCEIGQEHLMFIFFPQNMYIECFLV